MAKKKKKVKALAKRDKEKIAQMAVKQIETAFRFKQPRMEEVLMNEDLYNGNPLPRLKGRFSVPLPTMGGYIDTLLSKQDEPPTILYSSDDPADKKAVNLTSKISQKEQRRRDMRFAAKDRNQKKLAAFSGVGIGQFFSESDPEYKNYYDIIDHYDFGAEPLGGESLEGHQYCGRINLFKSEWEIEDLAESDYYDKNQVTKLFGATDEDKKKKNKELFKNKVDRFRRYGLDIESADYLGDSVYSLAWWGVTYKGVRYLVTLDYETGTWLRIVPLKEHDKSGLWPWFAWHTHPDEFNFWSKGPADDLRPIAIGIDILFNQALDNRQKRNFGMRAFDPNIFPNPEEFEWRPDGLVEANTMGGLKKIGDGIYEFKTEEITGTVDMITFMDQYTAQKTGITPSAQGESDEKRVGIYYGDLQQVADRLGLYNKSYSEYHEDIGIRFLWGMVQHLDEDTAVDMLGLEGTEEDFVLTERIKPEWDVEVSGGQAEVRASEMKKTKRKESIDQISGNPVLLARVNPDVMVREILRNGEWTDDEIAQWQDLSDSDDAELIGEADYAIQQILEGKEPKLNRAATTAYIKHIVRFATRTTFDEDPKKDVAMFERIMAFADKHFPIAQQNAVMAAKEMELARNIEMLKGGGPEKGNAMGAGMGGGTPVPGAGGGPTPEGTPTPESAAPGGTAEGTARMSQETTAEVTP